jgi:hypothetical protein
MKKVSMMRTCAAVAALFGLLAFGAAAHAQGKVDLSGTWTFDVQTDAGGGTPTVTLKQDGTKLTGHYSSQTFGEQDLAGEIDGQNVTITINADIQGTALAVVYKGTIESKDAMKGTVDLGGLGTGTWTGKRQ